MNAKIGLEHKGIKQERRHSTTDGSPFVGFQDNDGYSTGNKLASLCSIH